MANQAKNQPEAKFVYQGGVGVAVWTNTIETADGPKKVRSLTINPRRYRDDNTGEWKDASSYRQRDIPALLLALQKAQEYLLSNPLNNDDVG